jgi:hypothetical protein
MNSCLTQLLTQGYNLFETGETGIETVIDQSSNSNELHKKLVWIFSTTFIFVCLSGFIFMYWKKHKNMSALHEIQKGMLKFNFVFLLSSIICFFFIQNN